MGTWKEREWRRAGMNDLICSLSHRHMGRAITSINKYIVALYNAHTTMPAQQCIHNRNTKHSSG